MKITSTMIVAVGARRCRLEGGRDARVGEPDAQGHQQPAKQRARRQHISSATDRPVVVRRCPRRRHGIVYRLSARNVTYAPYYAYTALSRFSRLFPSLSLLGRQ